MEEKQTLILRFDLFFVVVYFGLEALCAAPEVTGACW